ncbi:flagellar hook-associated protein FlgL [Limnobacter sp.]|uniref:flagellar hook-associated protein FlgL n=1 Tax=Limnobacter sp. TaxID=2003368 RepID=UPI0035118DA7
MMRVSTLQYFQGNIGKLTDMQARLSNLQNQISSGVEVQKPSDDPSRLFQGIQAQRGINRGEQLNRNISFARNQLEQADGALGQATNNMLEIKFRMVQAANGTLSASDRSSIAITLQAMREELLQLFNQKDVSGRYLFSGTEEEQATFESDPASGVAYPVYQGQTAAAGAGGLSVEVGAGVFVRLGVLGSDSMVLQVADPLAGTPEVNVFSLLDDAVSLLNGNAPIDDIRAVAGQLDEVFEKLQNSRAALGIRMAALDANEAINDAELTSLSQLKRDSLDVDAAQAISELVQGQAQMQAFQLSYSNIAKLSLFNFIT